MVACVFFEWGYCKLMHRENPTGDFSAVVTGLLLAFNLPATLPWWMAIVGAFIAIVVVKQLFGGLGYNFANPAIVGRIAMAMGFAGAMSSYPHPVNDIDAFASATPPGCGRAGGLRQLPDPAVGQSRRRAGRDLRYHHPHRRHLPHCHPRSSAPPSP